MQGHFWANLARNQQAAWRWGAGGLPFSFTRVKKSSRLASVDQGVRELVLLRLHNPHAPA